MLASQASRLLARGQAAQAALFPAAITIAAQSYAAGTSGISKDQRLGEGGFTAIRRVSFWVPRSAFGTEPAAPAALVCTAPAALAGAYTLDEVRSDPAGVNLILVCTAPSQ